MERLEEICADARRLDVAMSKVNRIFSMAADFDPEPHLLRLEYIARRMEAIEACGSDPHGEYAALLEEDHRITTLLRLRGLEHPLIEAR